MKNKKQSKFDISVHYSIAGRKRYKRKIWLIFALLMVVMIICAVMFYFANYDWNPEDDFKPTVHLETWWQILLFVLATIISITSIVLVTIYCFKDISKFYKTQEEYFKTPKFKEAKEKVLKSDLSKLDKKTLKWYKKLGYLTSTQVTDILSNKSDKQKR